MPNADQIVAEAIANNKLLIFSKSYCPYCIRAKEAIASFGVKATVLELDERDDMDEIQNVLQRLTGARSVPRVFVDGKFIGGCDDTLRQISSGEFRRKLEAAGLL